jgi:hypothetical protein
MNSFKVKFSFGAFYLFCFVYDDASCYCSGYSTASIQKKHSGIIQKLLKIRRLNCCSEGAGKLYQVGDHLLCVLEGTHKEMASHGNCLQIRSNTL